MNVLIVSGKVKFAPRHGTTKKGTHFVSATIVSQNPKWQKDEYFNVVGFGKVSEAMQTLEVGQMIMATGEAAADVYDKEGKHYANLKCYANNIELIGQSTEQQPKQKIDPADYPPKDFGNPPAKKPSPAPAQTAQSADDDVPF